MDFTPVLAGFGRIFAQDKIAILIAIVLMALQVGYLIHVYWRCSRPLRLATANVETLSSLLSVEKPTPSRIQEAVHRSYPNLRETWDIFLEYRGIDLVARSPIDPEEVFSGDRLLPTNFNGRLDGAAPGLFTGLGILGTFFGLILGFVQVNPEIATESVSPLLGGMVVAFFNSALGVSLSLWWSWRSRARRHRFDTAVTSLGQTLARGKVLTFTRPEDALLNRVGELIEATDRSAMDMAATLGPRLEEAFRGLVNAPFDRLVTAVQSFESAMNASAAQQQTMQVTLQAGTVALDEARQRITQVVIEVGSVLDDLGVAGLRLQEAVTATQVPLERASMIAERTGQVLTSLEAATTRQVEATHAMGSAASALSGTSSALEMHSTGFVAATQRLEAAVAVIHQATERAVGATVEAAREELRVAIVELQKGLREETQTTIRAYGEVTKGIVETVDTKMTDLTDRLEAQLATLTSRLPAEVEQVHAAMRLFREQIGEALRSINEAVRQLSQETPQVLQRQLTGYDKALADAVDHFGGTLKNWNGNIEAIGALGRQLDGIRIALERRGDEPDREIRQ